MWLDQEQVSWIACGQTCLDNLRLRNIFPKPVSIHLDRENILLHNPDWSNSFWQTRYFSILHLINADWFEYKRRKILTGSIRWKVWNWGRNVWRKYEPPNYFLPDQWGLFSMPCFSRSATLNQLLVMYLSLVIPCQTNSSLTKGLLHKFWIREAYLVVMCLSLVLRVKLIQHLRYNQCVTAPKMLDDTHTDTFSGTKYFRYR